MRVQDYLTQASPKQIPASGGAAQAAAVGCDAEMAEAQREGEEGRDGRAGGKRAAAAPAAGERGGKRAASAAPFTSGSPPGCTEDDAETEKEETPRILPAGASQGSADDDVIVLDDDDDDVAEPAEPAEPAQRSGAAAAAAGGRGKAPVAVGVKGKGAGLQAAVGGGHDAISFEARIQPASARPFNAAAAVRGETCTPSQSECF